MAEQIYDMEEMKRDLLNQTRGSYDRREGEINTKYFNPEVDVKYYRPAPTKGTPHIIDIIPFRAGKFTPKTSEIRPGGWAYVLDLYVHTNVGPSKEMVVCPLKNYGNPCPICEEVDNLMREGAEWSDIPFVAKRRCSYNVLVMDDAKTEAEGIQIWEASYNYTEKEIVSRAKATRGNGFIAFSAPDKETGRSIAFEVENDTFKKITGHRLEMRDYDIPLDIVAQAHVLDEMIIILNEDQIRKALYGPTGKRPADISLLLKTSEETKDVKQPAAETEEVVTFKPSLRNQATQTEIKTEPVCPWGAKFGTDFSKYEDCDTCELQQTCAEARDRIDRTSLTSKPSLRQQTQVAPSPEETRRPIQRRPTT